MPRSANDTDHFPDGSPVPEGLEFIELVRAQESACEVAIDDRLPGLGARTPQLYERLGTLLSLLDRMSSCWWGCPKGDHVLEYLVGRCVSSARGGLRLVRGGFYDESLVLTRSIGEVANLLFLFSQDHELFDRWKAMSPKDRWKEFGPGKVRKKLEGRKEISLVDATRYGALSHLGTHPSPDLKPQAYNPVGLPLAPAIPQDAGIVLSLNELGYAMGVLAIGGSLLAEIDKSHRIRILKVGKSVIESVGRLTIDEYWKADTQTIALWETIAAEEQERLEKDQPPVSD